jgi:hypothetical protein
MNLTVSVFSTAEFALARVLYETMEHLDPQEGRHWDDFQEDEREYFCLCVRALIRRYDLMAAALGDDNLINRRT